MGLHNEINDFLASCSFPWWKKAAEYYPMSLVKTAELDPSKSYVFGFHPHGIISMSAFVAFATEGLNVSKVFPGTQSAAEFAPRMVEPEPATHLPQECLTKSGAGCRLNFPRADLGAEFLHTLCQRCAPAAWHG